MKPGAERFHWLIAFALFSSLLYWLDIPETLNQWANINPHFLLTALLLLVTSYLTRALRLGMMLKEHYPGSFAEYFKISNLHIALGNLLPFRIGELSLLAIMNKQAGLTWQGSTGTLLLMRLLDFYYLACLWFLMIINWNWTAKALFMILSLLPPLIVSALPDRSRTGRWHRFHSLLPRSRWQLSGVSLLTMGNWLCKLTALYLLMTGFLPLPANVLASSIVFAELSNALPVQGLAGLGSYEAAALLGLHLQGIETSSGLSAAFNLHLLVLLVSLVMALPSWPILRNLWQKTRN